MKVQTKWSFGWLLLPVLCLVWGSYSYHRPEIVEKIERLGYDHHLVRLDTPRVSPEIVLVMAGETSLANLGRWPWPRSVHAKLLDNLDQAHTVVLDILFPETSRPEEDRALVAAAERMKNLVLAMHIAPTAGEGNHQILMPFPMLNQVPRSLGFTNMETDTDGLVRYCRPYRPFEGRTIPSLPLAAAYAIQGEPPPFNTASQNGVLQNRAANLPVDDDGKLWINHGNSESTVYEYWQVLNGDVPRKVFRDKIVLVGVSAPGIEDYFKIPTPFGGREISGTQLNCNIIKSLLTGKAPRRVPPLLDGALTILMVLAGAGITAIRRPKWNFIAMALLAGTFLFLHQHLFVSHYIYTALFLPLSGMLTSFSLLLFLKLKAIHHVTEIKTFSISSIIDLPSRLNEETNTFDGYLRSIWNEIQQSTGIHLLSPQTPWNEIIHELPLKAKPDNAPAHDKVILVEDRKGLHRHLAMIPVSSLHPSKEQAYTLLGWHRRVPDPHIQAVVAVVLSTAWYFERLRKTHQQKRLLLDTIHAISAAIDAKDPVTGGHSNRVSILAREIAEQLNLEQHVQDDIYLGALILDIGKIGVPDSILSKDGRLTDAEMDTIRRHPSVGKKIMASVKLPEPVVRAICEHHERYDGSGYPRGLKGEQINLAGRIIAVADVFDALISDRPYREAMPLEDALAYMQASADIEFDGAVVRALCSVMARIGERVPEREPLAMAS